MVCFTADGTDYCLPVEATRSVRRAEGLVRLPDARGDVAGILADAPPLTVLNPLGGDGGLILVVEADGRTYGLLVDAVTGLVRVRPDAISLSPEGQGRALVSGTMQRGDQLVLVADPVAMAARL